MLEGEHRAPGVALLVRSQAEVQRVCLASLTPALSRRERGFELDA